MTEEIDLDNLEFHEQLGEGAYGTVNRVTFKKPFKGYSEAAAKSIRSLRREEIEIMHKLHHPHIVSLLAFYSKGPINMIILEYAQNGSLHDYLANLSRPLPIDLKLTWMKQAALAIEYLHDSNFIHRDIKARNYLLFQDNVLKICDFGLARAIHHSQSSSSIKGTFCYMAPEIHVGNERGRSEYSKPADIYAYGMLMLEIFTRKPPFDGMEWQMIVFQIGSGQQPVIPSNCPQILAGIMRHCWSANPKRRPTIQDILQGYPFDSTGNGLAEELSARKLCRTLAHDLQEPLAAGQQETGKWKVVNTITPMHHGRSLKAHTIACCPNGDVVVSYWEPGQVFIYGSNGECKMQLTSLETEEKQIDYVMGVAVSSQGHIVTIGLYNRFVHVFNSDGQYLHCFSILEPDENPNTKIHPKCVAIDQDGCVLVGDWQRKLITIHSTCPEGKLVKKVVCANYEDRMTVNSKNLILYACKSPNSVYDMVVAIDYTGHKVFTFTPMVDEDLTSCTDHEKTDCRRMSIEGIVCDSQDAIYLVMQVCEGYDTVANTGHLHHYSAAGAFMSCVQRGIDDPHDLAIVSDETLIVTNHKSVLVYSSK